MFYTLPEKIGKYIDQFTGRVWLLPKILDWYENSSERMLLITGDPGTGKSMVAAWLAGSGPLPDDPAPGTTLPDSLLFNGLLPLSWPNNAIRPRIRWKARITPKGYSS